MDPFITPEERLERITDRMFDLGITSIGRLAAIVGMQQTSLKRSLHKGSLTLETIERLAVALDCKAGFLIDRKGKP